VTYIHILLALVLDPVVEAVVEEDFYIPFVRSVPASAGLVGADHIPLVHAVDIVDVEAVKEDIHIDSVVVCTQPDFEAGRIHPDSEPAHNPSDFVVVEVVEAASNCTLVVEELQSHTGNSHPEESRTFVAVEEEPVGAVYFRN